MLDPEKELSSSDDVITGLVGKNSVLGTKLRMGDLLAGDTLSDTMTVELRNGNRAALRLLLVPDNAHKQEVWLLLDEIGDGGVSTAYRCVAEEMFDLLKHISEAVNNLGHDQFKDINQRAKRHLTSILTTLRESGDRLNAVMDVCRTIDAPAELTTVDLNLTAADLFERLRGRMPERKINLSYSDLPSVTAARRELGWLLEVLSVNLVLNSTESPFNLSLAAEETENGWALILGSETNQLPKRNSLETLTDCRAILGSFTLGDGVIWNRLFDACLAKLQASLSISSTGKQGATLTLSLPQA
jgi:light-regulated signal transduction histidine kinase (bacteriophytochrome)